MSAIKEFKENNDIKSLSDTEVQFTDNGRWVKTNTLSENKARYFDSLYWALYKELNYPKRKKRVAFISKDNENNIRVVHSESDSKILLQLKKIKQDIKDFVDTFSD